MIHCLSCDKYPKDENVIPYGSTFPIDTFNVKLVTNNRPMTMPSSGADVVNLPDDTKFAVGSRLYVMNEGSDSEVYVFVDGGFLLWDSPLPLDYE